MAFKDFASVQYVKTVDTSESPRMGSFSLASSGELGHIRTVLYINGTMSGTEQFRIRVCGDSACSSALATSDWMDLADITDENGNIATGDWVGFVTADFNRENLNKDITYYTAIDFNNYTRNTETFYIGVCHDFPYPIADNSEDLFYNHPLVMAIFTHTERT